MSIPLTFVEGAIEALAKVVQSYLVAIGAKAETSVLADQIRAVGVLVGGIKAAAEEHPVYAIVGLIAGMEAGAIGGEVVAAALAPVLVDIGIVGASAVAAAAVAEVVSQLVVAEGVQSVVENILVSAPDLASLVNSTLGNLSGWNDGVTTFRNFSLPSDVGPTWGTPAQINPGLFTMYDLNGNLAGTENYQPDGSVILTDNRGAGVTVSGQMDDHYFNSSDYATITINGGVLTMGPPGSAINVTGGNNFLNLTPGTYANIQGQGFTVTNGPGTTLAVLDGTSVVDYGAYGDITVLGTQNISINASHQTVSSVAGSFFNLQGGSDVVNLGPSSVVTLNLGTGYTVNAVDAGSTVAIGDGVDAVLTGMGGHAVVEGNGINLSTSFLQVDSVDNTSFNLYGGESAVDLAANDALTLQNGQAYTIGTYGLDDSVTMMANTTGTFTGTPVVVNLDGPGTTVYANSDLIVTLPGISANIVGFGNNVQAGDGAFLQFNQGSSNFVYGNSFTTALNDGSQASINGDIIMSDASTLKQVSTDASGGVNEVISTNKTDGSWSDTFFDTANTQSWSSMELFHDDTGLVIGQFTQQDSGATSATSLDTSTGFLDTVINSATPPEIIPSEPLLFFPPDPTPVFRSGPNGDLLTQNLGFDNALPNLSPFPLAPIPTFTQSFEPEPVSIYQPPSASTFTPIFSPSPFEASSFTPLNLASALSDPFAGDFGFGGSIGGLGSFDPLVFNLAGGDVTTISERAHPLSFDWNGTGRATNTGWITAHEGFLVTDKEHNGIANNGHDMITDLSELRMRFDTNGDGVINANDVGFDQLKLLVLGHEQSLADFGISQINLASSVVNKADHGNTIGSTFSFNWASGGSGQAAEVVLRHD